MELRALWILYALPAALLFYWALSMADSLNQCSDVFDREMKQMWQAGKLPPAGSITDSEPCRRADAKAKVTQAVVTSVAATR